MLLFIEVRTRRNGVGSVSFHYRRRLPALHKVMKTDAPFASFDFYEIGANKRSNVAKACGFQNYLA